MGNQSGASEPEPAELPEVGGGLQHPGHMYPGKGADQ